MKVSRDKHRGWSQPLLLNPSQLSVPKWQSKSSEETIRCKSSPQLQKTSLFEVHDIPQLSPTSAPKAPPGRGARDQIIMLFEAGEVLVLEIRHPVVTKHHMIYCGYIQSTNHRVYCVPSFASSENRSVEGLKAVCLQSLLRRG